MRKQLRDRLLKRMGRNLTTIGPLLTGAADRRRAEPPGHQDLGEQVRDDLRKTASAAAAAGLTVRAAPLTSRGSAGSRLVSACDRENVARSSRAVREASGGLGHARPVGELSASAADQRGRPARAHDPVRRGVGRVVQHDQHRAAHPRPLHHERERVQLRPERTAASPRRPAARRTRRLQRRTIRASSTTRARRRSTETRSRPSHQQRRGREPGAVTAYGSQLRTPPWPRWSSAAIRAAAARRAGPDPPGDRSAARAYRGLVSGHRVTYAGVRMSRRPDRAG